MNPVLFGKIASRRCENQLRGIESPFILPRPGAVLNPCPRNL